MTFTTDLEKLTFYWPLREDAPGLQELTIQVINKLNEEPPLCERSKQRLYIVRLETFKIFDIGYALGVLDPDLKRIDEVPRYIKQKIINHLLEGKGYFDELIFTMCDYSKRGCFLESKDYRMADVEKLFKKRSKNTFS